MNCYSEFLYTLNSEKTFYLTAAIFLDINILIYFLFDKANRIKLENEHYKFIN